MTETQAWRNDAVWHQLLCLLPLLAVTNNIADAVAIGVAAFTLLVTSNVIISALRVFIPATARLPAYALLIGLCTSSIMMFMQVYAFDSHQRVALFTQVVLCNCILLAQAERTARQNPIRTSLIHSVVAGGGFFALLLLMGVIREGAPGDLPATLLPACVFFVAALTIAARNALVLRV